MPSPRLTESSQRSLQTTFWACSGPQISLRPVSQRVRNSQQPANDAETLPTNTQERHMMIRHIGTKYKQKKMCLWSIWLLKGMKLNGKLSSGSSAIARTSTSWIFKCLLKLVAEISLKDTLHQKDTTSTNLHYSYIKQLKPATFFLTPAHKILHSWHDLARHAASKCKAHPLHWLHADQRDASKVLTVLCLQCCAVCRMQIQRALWRPNSISSLLQNPHQCN